MADTGDLSEALADNESIKSDCAILLSCEISRKPQSTELSRDKRAKNAETMLRSAMSVVSPSPVLIACIIMYQDITRRLMDRLGSLVS